MLEVHRESFVRAPERPASWFSAAESVFGDAPHLVLRESFWHERECAATERWFVSEAGSDGWQTYTSTTQAYAEDDYAPLLAGAGLASSALYASLDPQARDSADGLFVVLAKP